VGRLPSHTEVIAIAPDKSASTQSCSCGQVVGRAPPEQASGLGFRVCLLSRRARCEDMPDDDEQLAGNGHIALAGGIPLASYSSRARHQAEVRMVVQAASTRTVRTS
jgi:hypothetical protein